MTNIFDGEKYKEASLKAIEFIKRQLNVNNYRLQKIYTENTLKNISLFALMLPTSFHLQKMDGRKLKKVEKVSEFLDYLNLITFAP